MSASKDVDNVLQNVTMKMKPESYVKQNIRFAWLGQEGSNRFDAVIIDHRRGRGGRILKWFGFCKWDHDDSYDWFTDIVPWINRCERSAVPYLDGFRQQALQEIRRAQ
jgi:hypothetical protein